VRTPTLPKLPKTPALKLPKLPSRARPIVDDDDGPTIEEMVEGLGQDILTEGQEFFKERREAEKARFQLNTDTGYWCALVFESREQKEAFLRHFDAVRIAGGDKYLNGYKMAQAMGVDVGPPVKWPGQKGPTPRLAKLAKR
jgi:hypothetical protein